MVRNVVISMPEDWLSFRLPQAVQDRLQSLLDRQDSGEVLTNEERSEAEGLVDIAELLSLLKAKAQLAEREASAS